MIKNSQIRLYNSKKIYLIIFLLFLYNSATSAQGQNYSVGVLSGLSGFSSNSSEISGYFISGNVRLILDKEIYLYFEGFYLATIEKVFSAGGGNLAEPTLYGGSIGAGTIIPITGKLENSLGIGISYIWDRMYSDKSGNAPGVNFHSLFSVSVAKFENGIEIVPLIGTEYVITFSNPAPTYYAVFIGCSLYFTGM